MTWPKFIPRKWTVALLIGAAAFVTVWDVFAWPTESTILKQWGHVTVALPWAVGMLAGHWFWNFKGEGPAPQSVPWKVVLNFSLLAALIAWDIWLPGVAADGREPGAWVLIGYACGRYLWGQRAP